MEKREYDPEIYDWEAQTEFELNDSGKRERFTTAYVRLLDDETLSDGAKILLLRLLAFQGTNSKAFPSLKKLCEVTGKGRTTIKRLLNELRECGWVLTKERFRPDNNGQSSNLFLLRDFAPHPEWVKSYKNSNAPVENSISAGGTPGPKMDRGV
ncbi:MAG: helix-turn-helix domain-containing protein, partial [Actinomycetes bacterium]|nr:helix-turn-helix domain-containing protein [Actinomycetes bacterium]